jgi:hypothetical protein
MLIPPREELTSPLLVIVLPITRALSVLFRSIPSRGYPVMVLLLTDKLREYSSMA